MNRPNALRDALAEALHAEWAPIACVSDLVRHDYAGCDTKGQWLVAADRMLERPAVAAALAGSGPEGDYDAVTCPTCGLRTCIGRLQYEDCAGSGPEAGLREAAERYWHAWNDPAPDGGWHNEYEMREAGAELRKALDAATPTASPTDPPHPTDHVGLCAVPSCPKYHEAASPTATGERDTR